MTGEGLTRHLLERAEARAAAILELAREESDARIARAAADAEREALAAEADLRREAEQIRSLRLGRARLEARQHLVRARAALADEVLQRLSERLARLPFESGYPELAARLFREILIELPEGEVTVRADAGSSAAIRARDDGGRFRLEPLPDEELGGVEGFDAGRTICIRNTLASRMRKATPALREEIGRMLGQPDE